MTITCETAELLNVQKRREYIMSAAGEKKAKGKRAGLFHLPAFAFNRSQTEIKLFSVVC
jgi:hypothetical protein